VCSIGKAISLSSGAIKTSRDRMVLSLTLSENHLTGDVVESSGHGAKTTKSKVAIKPLVCAKDYPPRNKH
jgi:hypothetical protein